MLMFIKLQIGKCLDLKGIGWGFPNVLHACSEAFLPLKFMLPDPRKIGQQTNPKVSITDVEDYWPRRKLPDFRSHCQRWLTRPLVWIILFDPQIAETPFPAHIAHA